MQRAIKKEVLEFYENGDEEKYFKQRLCPGRKDRLRNEKERKKQYLGSQRLMSLTCIPTVFFVLGVLSLLRELDLITLFLPF